MEIRLLYALRAGKQACSSLLRVNMPPLPESEGRFAPRRASVPAQIMAKIFPLRRQVPVAPRRRQVSSIAE